MRKLSKYEKETIINWNEAENLASVYTFNASLKRRLADFSRKYPLLCRGAGAAAHCWGQGATPIGRVQGGSACAECRGGEPLLRCPEVENLGPGKVDACVNLYWVLPDADFRRICGFAALPRPRNIFAGRREIVSN